MKPREWWIVNNVAAGHVDVIENHGDDTLSPPWVLVIEKSAYDRLEAMCEKLAETLEFLIEEGLLVHSNALEEYRAMRDETKMPCPDKDIDPLG